MNFLSEKFEINCAVKGNVIGLSYPDFCRKISIKYPSNQINTRSGGFVILSDFHGVSALELGV